MRQAHAHAGVAVQRDLHIFPIYPVLRFSSPSSARVTVPLNGATISAPFLAAISTPPVISAHRTGNKCILRHGPHACCTRQPLFYQFVEPAEAVSVFCGSGCRACVQGVSSRGAESSCMGSSSTPFRSSSKWQWLRWQRRCFPPGQPLHQLAPCRRAAPKLAAMGIARDDAAAVIQQHILAVIFQSYSASNTVPPQTANLRASPRSNIYSAVARTELCADVFILRHGPDRGRDVSNVNTLSDGPARCFQAAQSVSLKPHLFRGLRRCASGQLPLHRSAAPSAAHAVRPAAKTAACAQRR